MKSQSFVDKNTGYKCIQLFDPIFCANIYIVVGVKDYKDVNKWIEDNFNLKNASKETEFSARTISIDGGMNVHMFFKAYKLDPYFCSHLAHEAFHAAHMILSYRGQLNDDPDGEETHAYFMSWIIKEALNELKGLKKK
jgi:hypothetical protein